MVSMDTFLAYLELEGLLQVGDPYKVGDFIAVNYSNGLVMKPILVSSSWISHTIAESICTQFRIEYNADIISMLGS